MPAAISVAFTRRVAVRPWLCSRSVAQDRDLFPRQCFQLLAEVALVVLDGEDVVRPAGDDVVRGAPLGVQSILCRRRRYAEGTTSALVGAVIVVCGSA